MRDVIKLKARSITAPLFNTVDFDEDFEEIPSLPEEVLSLVETVSGVVLFDGVNTETPITHYIYVMYNPLITAEVWIEFENKRIDIVRVEDLDERHEFLKLFCNDQGLISKEASKQ
ncbi:MAG: phage head closure protein [Gammaproteobacteria bacterium]|nr:phage head closure protein [Gammaproteobacteria bacterium]